MYCQHLSGVGHFVRSREIVRALSKRHSVWFVTGGLEVPGPQLNSSVRRVRLAGIRRSKAGLEPLTETRDLKDTFKHRKTALTTLFSKVRPDVLVIEHFPFSKWILEKEILSVIELARISNLHTRILCSVRDYPMGHEARIDSERYQTEVVTQLNAKFDALLVHSDPNCVKIETLLPWLSEVSIPIYHTGYVSEKLSLLGAHRNRDDGVEGPRHVLVSCGGLQEELRLANLCVSAWLELLERKKTDGRKMVIFAGLSTEHKKFRQLTRRAQNGAFEIRPFTDRFLSWMPTADLSISQGGYNTTMNLLETRTRSILAPNPAMSDQVYRARMMEVKRLASIIDATKICSTSLADRIRVQLAQPLPDHQLDLEGAHNTCAIIEQVQQTSEK